MNYIEQLQTAEWQLKREEIILRDNSQCSKCKKERNKILNLSKSFGIIDFKDLETNNVFFVDSKILKSEGIFLLHENFMGRCYYIGYKNHIPKLSEMKYAMQWTGSGISDKKTIRYVCFDNDIEIADMYDLNVHHKYYVRGRYAWEYPNDALITLCTNCHKKEHETKEISIFNKDGAFQYNAETCPKCSGSGVLPEYHYYMNGICFQCMGTGNINI